jgi:Tol biopolymer transport system component
MPLPVGATLGPYEIQGLLGEGGMGEVYRARDTRLDRDVALKCLPAAFASDPERLARFEREAKTLAALNHPNIASIYGLERTGTTPVLVMELVPGRTLDHILAVDGALSPEIAATIAAQIAEGLEAAHEAGIVHRDLKPANIKRRDDDVVKLLDFGLARAMDTASAASGSAADTVSSPTMLSPAVTQQGIVLGTAGYMSPEQARGRIADKRSDIWAFGVVLYEMLTGKRLFAGETVTEVIATVIKDAPDLSALPAGTPPALRALLERCLDRDVKTRLRDIGEARVALGRASEPSRGPVAPASTAGTAARLATRELAAWGLAAAAVVVAAGLWLTRDSLASRETSLRITRTMIPPPEGTAFDFDVTVGPAVISPDGRHVAFSARSREGRIQLWVRALDSTDARAIDSTDGASFPFWSSDSRSIAFYSPGRGRLERVDLAGGAPIAVASAGFVRGASWRNETIVYDTTTGGARIMAVPVAGGEPRTVIAGGVPRSPWLLPDGRHLLYSQRDSLQIRVVGLDGTGDALVTDATSNAIYANGHLLFMREETLLAQPFDLARRAVTGTAVAVAKGVQQAVGEPRAVFSASDTGMLLYQDGGTTANSLAWFDPSGQRPVPAGDLGAARGLALSPDNRFAVVGIAGADGQLDLWRVNLASRERNRLTSGAKELSMFAAWSPDGRYVAYAVRRDGKQFVARTNAGGGPEERLFEIPVEDTRGAMARVTSWARDNSTILYASQEEGGMRMLRGTGGPGSPRTTTRIAPDVNAGLNIQLSPNEKWIAFQASAPGNVAVSAIFVDAYPNGGRRQLVAERGTLPIWSADGKALYFAIDNQLRMATATEGDGALQLGPPRPLMPIIVGRGYSYDVANDGRILALVTSEHRAMRPLTLVQNWLAALK